MITHKIKVSADYQVTTYAPGRRSYLATAPTINDQAALDKYLQENAWAVPGLCMRFDYTNELNQPQQVHLIVGVEKDFSKVVKPYNGFDKDPKCFRIVCLNMTKGVSTWDRMDSISGYRILTKEELEKWVINNDYVQDNLKLWKGQNGVEFSITDESTGPELQGDCSTSGTCEV